MKIDKYFLMDGKLKNGRSKQRCIIWECTAIVRYTYKIEHLKYNHEKEFYYVDNKQPVYDHTKKRLSGTIITTCLMCEEPFNNFDKFSNHRR